MVSILPRVDLTENNTDMDWFCALPLFQLDILPEAVYIKIIL